MVHRQDEKNYFNKVGLFSSDIYYVNEDRKTASKALVKGTSRQVAEALLLDHKDRIQARHAKMSQEADERIKVMDKIKDEDALEKEKK